VSSVSLVDEPPGRRGCTDHGRLLVRRSSLGNVARLEDSIASYIDTALEEMNAVNAGSPRKALTAAHVALATATGRAAEDISASFVSPVALS